MEFKEYLLQELLKRQKKNPVFSQRAFARLLAVDSSRLSKMLRGERPIKADFVESFGAKLGLGEKEIQGFLESGDQQETFRKKRSRYYKPISEDHFQVVSDWRHYAILELMKMPGFKTDPEWIARALKTTPLVIQDGIERLQRVGLLRISKRGKWQDLSHGFSSDILAPNSATQAQRANQMEFLQKAQAALLETPMDQRSQSSVMMMTSRKRIDAAKERIKKFRRELTEFLESGVDKEELFVLSVSLFPLTNLENGTGEG